MGLFFFWGGADEGEDLRNAAIRELREESGVTSTEFLAESKIDLIVAGEQIIKVKHRSGKVTIYLEMVNALYIVVLLLIDK
ncbi:uncharacterized protein LOC116112376 isoform X3 [Pistacia vera]|uniref:uncharacterized protein LOC116112376 isoform X3 n=1 Tax=Pistacia vera TaxID=55513 RepID=UPI0012632CE7|nr:uncharacterized protein LOC116112376 isoform X3 [Pistacia vera]